MTSMPEPAHDAVREKAALQFRNLSVVAAGMGSLGLKVVDAIAGMHIPSAIHLIDADGFKTEGLGTRPFIGSSAIDQDKALFVARHAARIHPAEDSDDPPQA